MSDGVMCYLKSQPEPCNNRCNFFEDTLACPFRTPREFWDGNLCQFCTKKISECRFGESVTRSKRTDDVVGCYGFLRKDEGDKDDF